MMKIRVTNPWGGGRCGIEIRKAKKKIRKAERGQTEFGKNSKGS